MEETPACAGCKRTHLKTGAPVKLQVTGEYAGFCLACRMRLVYCVTPPPQPAPRPGVESNTRSLDSFIARRRERLARNQRRVNVPLSH